MDTSSSDSQSAAKRLQILQGHLKGPKVKLEECSGKDVGSSAPMSSSKTEVQRAFPRNRLAVLKWNGWGYKDSGFMLDDKNIAKFIGKRYAMAGQNYPQVVPWFEKTLGFDPSQTSFSQPHPTEKDLPAPIPCPKFIDDIRTYCIAITDEPGDRLFHSHGHTCRELFSLRMGKYGRIVDLVIWPSCHGDVEKIVLAAVKHNVCIIPFGGGTNVSGALVCPEHEKRPIISLDMTEMEKILWIDEDNLTAHVEAGIIGQDLERKLEKKGYTSGHEPDSQEFSSVGGWVATRSSGMKKNVYGNIEDLVLLVRMITPQGTVEKNCLGPRNSMGPDLQHLMLGSEGILGVITEVTIRIRPIPEVRRYGSIPFPLFEDGVKFMREVARQRCAPASIRLMDNLQFQMGVMMKPEGSYFASLIESIKKLYLTKFKGFDLEKMCACTLVFEGTAEEVSTQERRIYDIAARFGGIAAGEEHGRRGYLLTFSIAYIRDLAFDYGYLAESFETSVPWNRVMETCNNVKDKIYFLCEKYGIRTKPMVSCRVTQTYDAGACIYYYMAFNFLGLSNPMKIFEEIEDSARDEILANGGSLSHHHGVGKIRKQWIKDSLSPTGIEVLQAVKQKLDPQNIFGADNILPGK